ncbi:MAG: YeeE/YedE family protein [Deltaproteobacteria bacterium]|nr:YeeE/YedE family protein [Deltaproteobacteria bacterium]
MWSRVGTGNLGAAFAVFGFAIGGLLAARSLFSFVTLWLTQAGLTLADTASIPTLLGVTPSSIILGGVAVIAVLLWRLPRPAPEPGAWPWYHTGLALGVLGTLAWVAGAPAGWHWGLSMTGPSRTLLGVLVDQAAHPMTWGAFMLLGVPLGSWLSAWSKGTARWQVAEARDLPRRFVGGLLMGFGGTVAGGCNIGNALTGLSILSLNSTA